MTPDGSAGDARFTMDVLREGFAAISDEMFVSLQRTSQSPIIYEVLDFGVGITDAVGELVSQGNGIAGFLGPLGDAVKETIARQMDLHSGDVIIANDPYAGGGTHLSDVALIRPVFAETEAGPELIGFAAAKGHWTEVGGKDPGSWTADSQDIYAEGLQLPFVYAYRNGEPLPDLRAILAANSRLPDMVLGDLTAQAACLEVAERRLLDMCARYGTATVRSAMEAVLDHSERLCRAALASIPHGVFTAEDFTDTDGLGNGPFPVTVRVQITDEGVTCDFTGSHGQVPGPINCTWSGLVSGVRTVFKAITDPAEPATDGWFRPLTIIAPPGCIFNATRPAPVAAYFEATEMASDLVWHALAPAFPDRLPAGTYVSVCSTSLALTHPDTGERSPAGRTAAGRLGSDPRRRRPAWPGLGRRRRDLHDPGRGRRAALRRNGRAVRLRHRRRCGRGPPAGRPRAGARVPDLQRRRPPHRRLGPPPLPALGSQRWARRLAELRRGPAGRPADRPSVRQGVPDAAAARGRRPAGDRHRRWLRRPARTRSRAVCWPTCGTS